MFLPNSCSRNLRSHLVLSLLSQICRTCVWVWDLYCSQMGWTIVQVILSHEYRWFHLSSHELAQNIECSSPSPVTLEILFCLFRTRFTNDLDLQKRKFCFIVFNDEMLRSCLFFLEKFYQVAAIVRTSLISVFHSCEDQARSSHHFK